MWCFVLFSGTPGETLPCGFSSRPPGHEGKRVLLCPATGVLIKLYLNSFSAIPSAQQGKQHKTTTPDNRHLKVWTFSLDAWWTIELITRRMTWCIHLIEEKTAKEKVCLLNTAQLLPHCAVLLLMGAGWVFSLPSPAWWWTPASGCPARPSWSSLTSKRRGPCPGAARVRGPAEGATRAPDADRQGYVSRDKDRRRLWDEMCPKWADIWGAFQYGREYGYISRDKDKPARWVLAGMSNHWRIAKYFVNFNVLFTKVT